MDAGAPKDLSRFFAAMLGVQRHLLSILKAKGPEEATAYASDLTGSCKGKTQTTTRLALPCLTDEDDAAAYISLFERTALSAQLPEVEWVSALASLLTGDALAAYYIARGDGGRQLTFQGLRAALLHRTLLAEESCRVRFRVQQDVGQGPRVLAQELLREATGWLKPHSRSGWEVTQCVVMEQFIASLPESVAAWVRAARPVSLDEAVKVAETPFLLSADSAQWKEARYESGSPDSPQRIPDEQASSAKLPANAMRTEAIETFTVSEQPEINAEEANLQGIVQDVVQSSFTEERLLPTPPFLFHCSHSLPSCSQKKDSSFSHGICNPGSNTSGNGDRSELICALQCPVSSLSGHWRQQSPGQSPSGAAAAEEGEGGYVCGKCGKSFLFFKSLHRHQRVHSEQGSFVCSDCGFPCRTSTGLKRHRAAHSGGKLFPCPDCSESFTYAERLLHYRTAHAALRPHRCSVCQKSFRLEKVLRKHEQTHRRNGDGSFSGAGPRIGAASAQN